MEISNITKKKREDGDFIQRRIVREQRKKDLIMKSKDLKSNGFSQSRRRLSVPPPIVPLEDTVSVLRDQMFAAVDQGTTDEVLSRTKEIAKGIPNNLTGSTACHPDNGQNILHYALSSGNMDLARRLVEEYGEPLVLSYQVVKRSDIEGRNTALHIITAAEKPDIEMAKYLLNYLKQLTKKENEVIDFMSAETAVEITRQRPRLFSCLLLAAYYGHSTMIKLYLDSGRFKVDDTNERKDTSLHWAARWGYIDAVKLLLKQKANPEMKNDKGSTALYWAVRYGHSETVILLLQNRANPDTTREQGLVAPLVVACAYGYIDIVRLLLDYDADVNIEIRGGETPIHHAAMEGYLEVIDLLVSKHATFDLPDELGDTPLLHAVQNGHVDIVYKLIECGCDRFHRNSEGKDMWYYAIEHDGDELLDYLIADQPRQVVEMKRTPMCIAASIGRCDKIDFLLKKKQAECDLEGNTFLHHAAMTDKHEVLEKFHSEIAFNKQNKDGDTALHIACYHGFDKSVRTLLKYKAKADVRNEKGETCLHAAACSRSISAVTVNTLVDYATKTHSWESLNAKDECGKTCLHIAGKFAKPDVIWEFQTVSIRAQDEDGYTPLHDAVRAGEPEALMRMLDIFESGKRDARINEQSRKKSETVLHLAADKGLTTCCERLIRLGCDISNRDVNGDTVLHRVVRKTVFDPENLNLHLDVFDTILKNIVQWWCNMKTVPCPDNRGELADMRREATLYVINKILNNEHLSVLELGFKISAPEIVSRLLMMRDVTMFEKAGSYTFDISNVIPHTSHAGHGCCPCAKVVPVCDTQGNNKAETNTHPGNELITHVVKNRATSILDIPPMKQLELYYTSIATRTFWLQMLLHIVYMSLFTYLAVDLLDKLRVDESQINCSDHQTRMLYIVVPIEPLVISVYTIITLCSKRESVRLSNLSSYLLRIVAIIYAVLVVIWIALFTLRYRYQDYFLAAALCLGWMLTISITRGIQKTFHYLYHMLISMVVKDVSRFLCVYLFVLIAFGFAFHILFQVSNEVIADYNTPLDTIFLAFNMMFGRGDLFEANGTFETNYTSADRGLTFIKLFYLLYLILGTLILLNLLIAMMNDSYREILTEHQVTWRIESVVLGIDMEKNLPCRKRLRKSSSILDDVKTQKQHWYVTIDADVVTRYSRDQSSPPATTPPPAATSPAISSRGNNRSLTAAFDDLKAILRPLMKSDTEEPRYKTIAGLSKFTLEIDWLYEETPGLTTKKVTTPLSAVLPAESMSPQTDGMPDIV